MTKDLVPGNFSRQTPSLFRDRFEEPFHALQQQMNRLFTGFFDDLKMESPQGMMFPRLDIKENDKELILEAEMPGMNEKDIDVTLSNNVLTLRGEKKQEKEEKEGQYYHVERSFGSFHRDIPLPCEIESDKVHASFKNGVLKIRLPKCPEVQKKAKRIEIKD